VPPWVKILVTPLHCTETGTVSLPARASGMGFSHCAVCFPTSLSLFNRLNTSYPEYIPNHIYQISRNPLFEYCNSACKQTDGSKNIITAKNCRGKMTENCPKIKVIFPQTSSHPVNAFDASIFERLWHFINV